MRILLAAFCVSAVSALALTEALALDANFDPNKAAYPGEVALSQPTPGHWLYRKFPSLTNLYIRDADPPGVSTCNLEEDGCAAAWPPLYAQDNEAPIGQWTIVVRKNGAKQWAYKGKPVYLRYHDLPEAAEKEGFHVLEP
jgi:predicted lipoprotein with Yx(FWY)xxD motif